VETTQRGYATPDKLRDFLRAMSGLSVGPALAIAQKFEWTRHATFIDLGTAQGELPVILAKAHPHLRGIGFDLSMVRPVFEEFVAGHGLSDRVAFKAGDFFADDLPKTDVIVMATSCTTVISPRRNCCSPRRSPRSRKAAP
jgi:hypothetical protein